MNARRSPAAIVLVGLLGLLGIVWLVWPKAPLRETLDESKAGSRWVVESGKAVLRGPTMGTQFTVVLPLAGADAGDRAALTELQAAIDAQLQAVNAEMSTYLPDSELSRFNARAAGEAVEVSEHLFEVVRLAEQVHRRSGGAFDVTVGPLVDAWGFGPGEPEARIELDDARIAELRTSVGGDKLELDASRRTLRKGVDGLRVDLSAIAKGHGCDRVATVLEAAGHDRYLVEIGGEVRVRGDNPDGEAWAVGVERPTADAAGERIVQQVLRVRDVSVATSGGYRNYQERDGVRYSHTIDPRTGRPITHTLASVTVIHRESAALADAWATALNVLGPEEGQAIAEREGLAAYFLVRTQAGFEVRTSSAFASIISEQVPE